MLLSFGQSESMIPFLAKIDVFQCLYTHGQSIYTGGRFGCLY